MNYRRRCRFELQKNCGRSWGFAAVQECCFYRELFGSKGGGIDLRRLSGFQSYIEHGGFHRLVAVSVIGFRNREHSHPDTLFCRFNQQCREVDSGTGRTVIDDDREMEVVLILIFENKRLLGNDRELIDFFALFVVGKSIFRLIKFSGNRIIMIR